MFWTIIRTINTPCPSVPVAIRFYNRRFKLNSKNSASTEKCKKVKFTGVSWFSTGDLSKNLQNKFLNHFHYQLSLKIQRFNKTLAKIQNARERSHHAILMENSQTFIVTCLCPTFPVKVQCLSVFLCKNP